MTSGRPAALTGSLAITSLRGRSVLVVCCAALFMTTLDSTILNVALPSLQRDLHASNAGLQWTVDSYVLVRAGTLFVCGALSDRFGRRRYFGIGLAIFVGGSLMCSLAWSTSDLIVWRGVQGVGGALMTPASLAIITNAFSERSTRARAIGAWSGTTGLSMAAGPVVGGLLVETLGWQSVFLVNVPIGAAVLFALRVLPDSRAATPKRFDIGGQLVLAAGLTCFTYALISAPSKGWSSPAIAACWVGSVVSIPLFLVVERRVRSPMIRLSYFRSAHLVGAVALAVVVFIALGAFLFFNTLYLQDVRGDSPIVAGLMTVPTTATSLVFAPFAGRLISRSGPRAPAIAACVLTALAMIVLSVTMTASVPAWWLVLCYLALGSGFGLVNPPATYSAVSSLPVDEAGVAAAITGTARQIGTNLGVALIGAVVFSSASLAVTAGRLAPAEGRLFTEALRHGFALAGALVALCAVAVSWCFSPARLVPLPSDASAADGPAVSSSSGSTIE